MCRSLQSLQSRSDHRIQQTNRRGPGAVLPMADVRQNSTREEYNKLRICQNEPHRSFIENVATCRIDKTGQHGELDGANNANHTQETYTTWSG
jgi:hypothetical protein